MRPLELVVEGFRSWDERHTFDWRGRQLVAIVGPIGSGKSSLLDAIAYALYARTPRIEKETAALIRHGCEEARVELTFEAGGSAWRAIRVIRRKGANLHSLVRWGDLEARGEPVEKLDRAREIDERITRAIGLDFTQFCRSVLLAQNQFARFLEASGGERDAVLKGLFGFERLDLMREGARRREDRSRAELGVLDRELGELERLADRQAPLESDLAAARLRLEQLEAARPTAEELATRRVAAQQAHQHHLDRLRELERIATELPTRDRVLEVEQGEAERRASRDHAQAELEGAETEQRRIELELEEESLRERGLQLAAAILELERATATSEACAHDEVEAIAAVDQARGEHERCRAAVESAEHHARASLLRAGLEIGEPCPVCSQKVDALPAAGATTDVEEVRVALRKSEGALRDAEHRRAETGRAHAAALARHEAHAHTVAQLREANPGLEPATAADPAALLPGASARIRQLRTEREVAQRRRELARAELERRQSELAGLGDTARELDRRLHHLAGRLEHELLANETLELRHRRLAELLEARRDEAKVGSREAAGELHLISVGATELLRSLGLAGDLDLGGAISEASHRVVRLDSELAHLRQRLEGRAALRARHAQETEALRIWGTLADDLKPSRLLRHLLDEERRTLAALASERFEVLSGGRYRFVPDGSFGVVDLANAEEQRRLETLSGGETFLAALALALALAEMVAGGGGRLDAFFLDEGFGSLDPEHLRLALDGIERLVVDAPNRLVVVVSHVAEVRERFDDVISLDREPHSGVSVVREPGADSAVAAELLPAP